MKDLFGIDVSDVVPRTKPRKDYAHAMPPGSGPAGETCRTCGNRVRKYTGCHTFNKCGLVRMTGGPGTDIRCRDAACAMWKPGEVKLLVCR